MQVTNRELTQTTKYEQPLSFHYERVGEIPGQCLFVAKLLESQPIFNGFGAIAKTCKVIPLESWPDVRIFDIFNNNAAKLTGTTAWHIREFGCGFNRQMDAAGQGIKQGLSLWLYDNIERCPLETLEQVYSNVYDAMRKGWVEYNPEDYPNMAFKEDSEKFTLFVKKTEMIEEAALISFLRTKFGLREQVKCHSEWVKDDCGISFNDDIYMWIDKVELSKIIEKFGFEVLLK